MTDDLIKITRDIVNKYSKMSVEELLKPTTIERGMRTKS